MSAGPPARPALSAIVLCYRAGEAAWKVVEPLHSDLSAAGIDFELLLVGNYDGGREDPTPAVLEAIGAKLPRVRSIAEEKRGGMGWDMRSGFDNARGEVLVVIDGDGQFDPGDVLRAYRELTGLNAAVVKGRRTKRGDGPWRGFQSSVFNLIYNLLFPGSGISDVNSKPKGMTRNAYERLRLSSDDWFIDAEIMLEARKQGLPVTEIPVVFRENEERDSFVAFGTAFEFLRHLLRYRLTGRP